MTQSESVLHYIREYGDITPMDALTQLGCFRLSARIHELRKLGYNIESEVEHNLNSQGKRCHYKRYFMKG
jgi:hypothetical protein